MSIIVLDCETDGFLDVLTKIHVLSYTRDGQTYHSLRDYDDMRKLLQEDAWFVAHSGIRFDAKVFWQILDIDIEDRIIDTLGLSWYLHPKRMRHGIESWGPEFGLAKPEVKDWDNLSYEEYAYRCEADTKINWKLWEKFLKELLAIYQGDKKEVFRLIRYLNFKMQCLAEQEEIQWDVDLERVQKNIEELTKFQDEKVEELKKHMPPNPVHEWRKKPKQLRRKDKTMTAAGMRWIEVLDHQALSHGHEEPVKVIKEYVAANPKSPEQVKEWLFSLGWQPCTFNYTKDANGVEKEIPQVRNKGELTSSVLRMTTQEPAIEVLANLSVIQHRLSIFKNFLKYSVDGKLKAQADGFTNTLRFKHRNPLVNIPGVDKPWGEEIRSCLIAPKGGILCGSDMVSLESNTKKHYMYPFDPKYVDEMSQPGFDEHLDLAVKARKLSQKDYDYYRDTDDKTTDRYSRIKELRKSFKPVNYGATYGIGAAKLSQAMGIKPDGAKQLLEAYWDRNWAVKACVKNLKVRTIKGQKWMKNPVSNFWYSLRYEKDRFSTLNQGTGVYCFDTWLMYIRRAGVVTCGQFHDEYIGPIDDTEGAKKKHTKTLKEAIKRVNEKLKLNVKLDVSIQYGKTYSDIH